FIGGPIIYTSAGFPTPFEWSREFGDALPFAYKNSVRGNSINDVVVTCDGGDILHFNGLNWRNFGDQTNLNTGKYTKIAIRDSIVVAVGESKNLAVLVVGRR